jgi:hypothetical protein
MAQPQLEHGAAAPKIANRAEHRALPGASLVKDVFPTMLRRIPTVNKIADPAHLSPPLTFADTPVFAIEPPADFEALTAALSAHCAGMMRYERGMPCEGGRKITPRLVLEVRGVRYLEFCTLRSRPPFTPVGNEGSEATQVRNVA